MKFLSRLLSLLFCLAVSFFSYFSQAQGGELLIQQYNQGPVLDNFYSRWSINLGITGMLPLNYSFFHEPSGCLHFR